jgi:hypothetical protein
VAVADTAWAVLEKLTASAVSWETAVAVVIWAV